MLLTGKTSRSARLPPAASSAPWPVQRETVGALMGLGMLRDFISNGEWRWTARPIFSSRIRRTTSFEKSRLPVSSARSLAWLEYLGAAMALVAPRDFGFRLA